MICPSFPQPLVNAGPPALWPSSKWRRHHVGLHLHQEGPFGHLISVFLTLIQTKNWVWCLLFFCLFSCKFGLALQATAQKQLLHLRWFVAAVVCEAKTPSPYCFILLCVFFALLFVGSTWIHWQLIHPVGISTHICHPVTPVDQLDF